MLYGIHPVAGRMPGHMNVLLAEANVPYEALKEMDEVNPEFATTDVALVVGANDVVNPAAKTTPGAPIYGMPILEVAEAQQVVFLKRSMRPGSPASRTSCSTTPAPCCSSATPRSRSPRWSTASRPCEHPGSYDDTPPPEVGSGVSSYDGGPASGAGLLLGARPVGAHRADGQPAAVAAVGEVDDEAQQPSR